MRSLARAAVIGLLALAAEATTAPPQGYLAGREPDILAVIPPPPAPGSEALAADRAIFRATRKLAGTPRWALATTDARLGPKDFYGDFSCAAGFSLDPARTPRLNALLGKMVPDLVAAFNPAKDHYRRSRPFLVDHGTVCEGRSKSFDASYDYPSGHATFGWAIGLVLAQALPGRAGPILGRARAFGESRVVCGVHSASAVMAGREAATTEMDALNADPAFRVDLAAVSAELQAQRASAPPATACAAEAALTRVQPW